jgi:Na+/H+-dicarboxylate symporter
VDFESAVLFGLVIGIFAGLGLEAYVEGSSVFGDGFVFKADCV